MNLDRHISMTQITWIVGTLVGLGLAVLMGSAIGSQDFRLVTIVLGAGVGIATFLILGKNYWMLIPFSLGASFPAVPIGGRSLEFPELAIVGCAVFFALRVASRKEKLQIFRTINIPILLFIAWVGMVFVLNPIGLAMLGSQTGRCSVLFQIGLRICCISHHVQPRITPTGHQMDIWASYFRRHFSLGLWFCFLLYCWSAD